MWFDLRLLGNSSERWNRIKNLFRDSEYEYEEKNTQVYATLIFPVLDKGKNDRDDWDEIRKKISQYGNRYLQYNQQIWLIVTHRSGRAKRNPTTPAQCAGGGYAQRRKTALVII